MNTINLNGKEYIEKSYYDELEEKKEDKKSSTPKKKELKLLREYAVLDPAKVLAIYPCIKHGSSEDITEIVNEIGLFKFIRTPKIRLISDNSFDSEIVEIEDTKYSMGYIDKVKEIGKIWNDNDDELNIYMRYDKKEEKFLKNQPILFVFGNNLSFILAPRVESEDEDDE